MAPESILKLYPISPIPKPTEAHHGALRRWNRGNICRSQREQVFTIPFNCKRVQLPLPALRHTQEVMTMEDIEKIKVHIHYNRHGHTDCICTPENKGCSRPCPLDVVYRDKYREWIKTMNNRYGK